MSTLSFTGALLQAEAQARSTLDVALHERLSCAVALVTEGRVFQTSHGDWQVESTSTEGLMHSVNGICDCDDVHFNHPPQDLCKHRIAIYLARRAQHLMGHPPAPLVAPESLQAAQTAEEPDEHGTSPDETTEKGEAPPEIPRQFVTWIQGKPFVQYRGLLAMAHERGLLTLEAKIEQYTPEYALASARAVFADGRSFSEWGDATPTNVNQKIAPHFARMALTRGKARCLRDALNIGVAAVEELK